MIVIDDTIFGLRGEAITRPRECQQCHTMKCFFQQTMKGWVCLECIPLNDPLVKLYQAEPQGGGERVD